MLGAISVWLAQKHKYLSMMLQFTLLPTAHASVSFESLSCGLCLMFYCGECFCKVFHSFPVTFSWTSLMNDYILVVVLLFVQYHHHQLWLWFSKPSVALNLQLQINSHLRICISSCSSWEAKTKVPFFLQVTCGVNVFSFIYVWQSTLNVLYCWGLKQFLVQKLKHSAFAESLAAVVFFLFFKHNFSEPRWIH